MLCFIYRYILLCLKRDHKLKLFLLFVSFYMKWKKRRSNPADLCRLLLLGRNSGNRKIPLLSWSTKGQLPLRNRKTMVFLHVRITLISLCFFPIFIFWYTGSDKWGKQASGVGKWLPAAGRRKAGGFFRLSFRPFCQQRIRIVFQGIM